jgi:hypothetical protein
VHPGSTRIAAHSSFLIVVILHSSRINYKVVGSTTFFDQTQTPREPVRSEHALGPRRVYCRDGPRVLASSEEFIKSITREPRRKRHSTPHSQGDRPPKVAAPPAFHKTTLIQYYSWERARSASHRRRCTVLERESRESSTSSRHLIVPSNPTVCMCGTKHCRTR